MTKLSLMHVCALLAVMMMPLSVLADVHSHEAPKAGAISIMAEDKIDMQVEDPDTVMLLSVEPEELAMATDAWQDREDAASLDAAIELYEQAVNEGEGPKTAVLTRLARAWNYKANVHIETQDDRKDAFHQGYHWGLKALETNKDFHKALDQHPTELPHALEHIGRDHAEALFWTTRNLMDMSRVEYVDDRFRARKAGETGYKWFGKKSGEDAEMTEDAEMAAEGDSGVMKAKRGIHYKPKSKPSPAEMVYHRRIESMIARLVRINDELYLGAPHILAAEFYATAPAVLGGNIGRAKYHYAQAAEVGPKMFWLHTSFARNWTVPMGDRYLFERRLYYVAGSSPDTIEGFEPEQRFYQTMAKQMLVNADTFFPVVRPEDDAGALDIYGGGNPAGEDNILYQ